MRVATARRRRMNARNLFVVIAIVCSGCVSVSPEFKQHYDTGSAAASAGDFENCIIELEAALEIDPDVSSLTWHRLSYCYREVGRYMDAWVAIRTAVIINPISSERKEAFYAVWGEWKSDVLLGSSSMEVRRQLGDPDVKAVGESSETWIYGLVSLEFEDDRLTAINE